MFAYCLNNPVIFMDAYGNRADYFAFCLDVDGRGYITDQHSEGIGEKQFGLATISHGGCGVLASYNALITLGDGKDFEDVLDYYNSKMLTTVGHGLTGLLPHDIARYFNSMGYSTVITDDLDFINALSKSADACIMYYMFPQTYNVGPLSIDAYGAHFVEYSRLGNSYTARNTSEDYGTYSFGDPAAYGERGSRYYVVGIFIYR